VLRQAKKKKKKEKKRNWKIDRDGSLTAEWAEKKGWKKTEEGQRMERKKRPGAVEPSKWIFSIASFLRSARSDVFLTSKFILLFSFFPPRLFLFSTGHSSPQRQANFHEQCTRVPLGSYTERTVVVVVVPLLLTRILSLVKGN
jgi:hypothetical protein